MATDYETLGTIAYSMMPMNYSVISATHSVCRFPNAKSEAERVGFRVRRIFSAPGTKTQSAAERPMKTNVMPGFDRA